MKRQIAFLWHMHQPYYGNPHKPVFELPWVRLHALKDYYGMVALLRDFPGIKATFNLVPSLLVQLDAYLQGQVDSFQQLFNLPAETLTTNEAEAIARHFFSANYRRLIKPYPRYNELFQKKQNRPIKHPHEANTLFSPQEWRDLQMWFSLCYFDEEYKKHDPEIKALLKKGYNFTEGDKQIIRNKEKALMAKIVPTYKQLAERGQIEISTTPFYHPILPLLVDPQSGRETNPHLPEYDLFFNWEEDAYTQIESALWYIEKIFGQRPVGIWPSEGSLSSTVLAMFTRLGVRWTATDEANLSKSLGILITRDQRARVVNPEVLYKPYILAGSGGGKQEQVRIFFRDRHLSDLIGFHYYKMSASRAAEDLIQRIKAIPIHLEPVIPIILDGENAWEYYHHSGREFLTEFFLRVDADPELETVTFSQVLGREPGILHEFKAGSWINGNFDIWIGHEEDRSAWRLLAGARQVLMASRDSVTVQQFEEALRYLSIAEGSDWFWWYGKENYTPDLDIFDRLFRQNVQRIYEVLGCEVPGQVFIPIAQIG